MNAWLVYDSYDSTIETLDADYEDIDFLHNLDVTNMYGLKNMLRIMRYRNVFKIY